MPEPTVAPRRRLSRRKRLVFALVPLALLCLVGELAVRAWRSRQGFAPFLGGSYRDLRIDLIRRSYPAAHDPLLGYVPRPGFASADNQWHAQVTIDADGMRQNGAPRPAGAWLLAAGDSFTFGDQVGDAETWPARLEQELARPVRNGGVFGYSFAQSVLRAQRMLAAQTATDLVLSFIPDDLLRCEESRRFTAIPWFDLRGGELVLRGVPVPDSAVDNELDSQRLRVLLGHSALVDVLAGNLAPSWWVAQRPVVRVHPPGTGVAIATKLLDQLVPDCRARGVRLLLVLQGHWPDAGSQQVLAHARTLGAATLDLCARFLAVAERTPTVQQQWFAGHMTAAGNAWAAREIAAALVPPTTAGRQTAAR
ncbi:MAG: hypothetical protein JNL08_11475 [Planctomycetes bacterium]|nr:hypothetical protein [Planctomycetota bacterium]